MDFDQFSEGRSATLFEKIDPVRPLRPECSVENDPILTLSLLDVHQKLVKPSVYTCFRHFCSGKKPVFILGRLGSVLIWKGRRLASWPMANAIGQRPKGQWPFGQWPWASGHPSGPKMTTLLMKSPILEQSSGSSGFGGCIGSAGNGVSRVRADPLPHAPGARMTVVTQTPSNNWIRNKLDPRPKTWC